MADFSFSNDLELQKLSAQVVCRVREQACFTACACFWKHNENARHDSDFEPQANDPEDFEAWDSLVRAAEGQEGGLNRNSSPNAISATRATYDRFLAKFPLFYAFWKRYADLEFTIAGTEAAESIYERGIASITCSVDLWTNYCVFKTETSHDADAIRELFERGAESIGIDFLAHPYWDKYIEFEERAEDRARIFHILRRVIQIPLHQYSRYFESYQKVSATRDVTELASPEVIAQLTQTIANETGTTSSNPAALAHEIRAKLDPLLWETFTNVQNEVKKRWTYEQNIKRPYFHVTDVEEDQLDNWRKYLDFEEAEGDYERTKFLYERCMVSTASYEDFWFRYMRWMSAHPDKIEEIRNIYQRASCIFVKVVQPAIRLSWARFEEVNGRADVAIAIHEAILIVLPDDFATMKSLIHLYRRQYGMDIAIQEVQKLISDTNILAESRGSLVTEWSRILSKTTGDVTAARQVFMNHQGQYLDAHSFWSGWLQFEIDQPDSKSPNYEQVRNIIKSVQEKTTLPTELAKDLYSRYMSYLESRCGSEHIEELIKLDIQANGPVNPATAYNVKLATNGG
ncbi:hypothetical protein MRB53_040145 [Persea americana]|nr:hypothetical protein MRB53_040145 [Persea americana]